MGKFYDLIIFPSLFDSPGSTQKGGGAYNAYLEKEKKKLLIS
jgi:hypothetical protein